MKTIKVETTMGNYSIELTCPVDPSKLDLYAAEYFRSLSYRKVSPKLDLPLANHFGQSEIDKKGNPVPKEGFKKKSLEWDADAAAKMGPVYEAEFPGVKAVVKKYEPELSNASATAKLNKAKADLAVKLALDEISVEDFKAEMAKLG